MPLSDFRQSLTAADPPDGQSSGETLEHRILNLRIRRFSGERAYVGKSDCFALIQRVREELHLRARQRTGYHAVVLLARRAG